MGLGPMGPIGAPWGPMGLIGALWGPMGPRGRQGQAHWRAVVGRGVGVWMSGTRETGNQWIEELVSGLWCAGGPKGPHRAPWGPMGPD